MVDYRMEGLFAPDCGSPGARGQEQLPRFRCGVVSDNSGFRQLAQFSKWVHGSARIVEAFSGPATRPSVRSVY
jgi:hypothetical protein